MITIMHAAVPLFAVASRMDFFSCAGTVVVLVVSKEALCLALGGGVAFKRAFQVQAAHR